MRCLSQPSFTNAEARVLDGDSLEQYKTRKCELPVRRARFPSSTSRSEKCVLPGFPYNVLFQIDDEGLFIVAVAHQRRRPAYWRPRSHDRA